MTQTLQLKKLSRGFIKDVPQDAYPGLTHCGLFKQACDINTNQTIRHYFLDNPRHVYI